MVGLKKHLVGLVESLYGQDRSEVDDQVEQLKRRVEARRAERCDAGVEQEDGRGYTARDYEEWMNLDD